MHASTINKSGKKLSKKDPQQQIDVIGKKYDSKPVVRKGRYLNRPPSPEVEFEDTSEFKTHESGQVYRVKK